MKKIFSVSILSLFIFASAFAGDDGELNLSKKSKPIKDCFEPINRVTFAVNMGLDKVIFKPVAKGYRVLPSPVRAGVSNAQGAKISHGSHAHKDHQRKQPCLNTSMIYVVQQPPGALHVAERIVDGRRIKTCSWNISQNSAKANWYQKKRLKALIDCQK